MSQVTAHKKARNTKNGKSREKDFAAELARANQLLSNDRKVPDRRPYIQPKKHNKYIGNNQ